MAYNYIKYKKREMNPVPVALCAHGTGLKKEAKMKKKVKKKEKKLKGKDVKKNSVEPVQLTQPAQAQEEMNIEAIISKMQQQLISIEKKIDGLLNKPLERKPFERKPFRSFEGPNRFDRGNRDGDSRERSFTKVICADCNRECEIPFKPSGDRPVYCRDCFSKHKDGGGGSFHGSENQRPGGRNKPFHKRGKEHKARRKF